MVSDLDQAITQQLCWALQALAAEAEDQLRLFPDFVDKPFELVSDFANWWETARQRGSFAVAPDQAESMAAISRTIEAIPEDAWTEASVRTARVWADLRVTAGEALQRFGWPLELPPDGRSAYVRGG